MHLAPGIFQSQMHFDPERHLAFPLTFQGIPLFYLFPITVKIGKTHAPDAVANGQRTTPPGKVTVQRIVLAPEKGKPLHSRLMVQVITYLPKPPPFLGRA